MVVSPSRSDGVGDALRSAFRGRMQIMPSDMMDLLSKLDV